MKRFWAMLVTLALLAGCLPMTVFGSEAPTSGICGDGLHWVLDEEGTLTVSGQGQMEDYWYSGPNAPWYPHADRIERIVVEEGVTRIGVYAFFECAAQEISLPDTLKTIGMGAFDHCTGLKAISIPDSVTELGTEAFADCESLADVDLGQGVPALGSHTFYQCLALKEITVPASVKTVGYLCFYRCTGLERVELESGVTLIEENAFRDCSALKRIVLSPTVQVLEKEAFANCTALEEVVLPSALEEIQGNPFVGCTALKQLVIPESVRSISQRLLSDPAVLPVIHFLGDAPELSGTLAPENPVTVVYEQGRAGWDDAVWQNTRLIPAEYTISRQQNCQTGGTEQISCAHCGLTETRQLPASHAFGPWRMEQEATAEAPGCFARSCTVCGESERIEIPAAVQAPASSDNLHDQNYGIWGSTVNSWLVGTPEGVTRIEALEEGVTVEHYDESFQFLSRRMLPRELDLFGGFHEGEDYYYLVFGQTNPEEDDFREVIRVVYYSKDWIRLGHVSMLGDGTTIPFDGGSCRMLEARGRLYVYTCREIYSLDGLNHQTNVMFSVKLDQIAGAGGETLKIPGVDMWNFTVSHSFNQFIQPDGDRFVTLDHGDGNPRAAVIGFSDSLETHKIMTFFGGDGDNLTGASLGAFLVSDSSYLTAGNSIRQDGTVSTYGQRNLFLGITSKAENVQDMTSRIRWLTAHSDDAQVEVSTPHMVALGNDRFLVLWNEWPKGDQEQRTLYWVTVNGAGESLGDVCRKEHISLSDCPPILTEGRVCWYVTDGAEPVFFSIEASDPTELQIHSPEFTITLHPNGGELEQETVTVRFGEPVGALPLPQRKGAYEFLGWKWQYPMELVTEDTIYLWMHDMECTAHWQYWEHEHEYEAVSVTPGNCTTPECTRMECIYCGSGYNSYQGSPVHQWDEGTLITPVSCTSDGLIRYCCTLCEAEREEQLPKTGHSYTTEVTAPTCTEKGFTTYTCPCGDSYIADETAPLGHNFGNWYVTEEATEEAEGEERRDCSRCDAFETRSIPKLAHTHKYTSAVTDPTCTEKGFTTYTCPCGDSYIADETAPLGHDFGNWYVTEEATEEAEGEERRDCSRCDAFETRSIPKLAHTHKYTSAVTDPTCTEKGFTTYTCPCGDSYIADETAPLGHDFGDWYVTEEATEEAEGEERRDCSRCDASETRSIPKLEHTHKYTSEVTSPTCTEKGFTTYTCPCGDSYIADETAPLGHNFGNWYVTKEPTEEAEGEERRDCDRCKESETRSIPKLEHTHRYYTVYVEPTCTEEGWIIRRCNCGEEYEESRTAPLGHEYREGVCIRCGAVANPFVDVEEGQWYFEPVLWAVEQGITSGTSATTFAPNAICSRAQVVTFLWRAMGSPEPASAENPFSDVNAADYFYKAVLWAVENGITSGTGGGKFSPNSPCTRSQVVTFLWRTMGQPAPQRTDNPFTDVASGIYYYQPVLWAVENGITSGTSATTFAPDNPCTRAQVVTFLYRALKDQ